MSVVVRLSVAVALVTSSILAGCGGMPIGLPAPTIPTPTGVTIPTPTGVSIPTSTPTPATPHTPRPPGQETVSTPSTPIAPVTTAAPALSTIQIAPDGLGSLRIGAPVPDQGDPSAMVVWDAEYCLEFPHPHGGSTGAFHANYPYTVSPALGSRAPFTVVTTHGEPDGTISSLIVFSPEVQTTVGLGVGASRSELTATYLNFDGQWAGPLSDVYALDGETGRLVFEVAKRPKAPLTDYWSDDVLDTVLWMMLVPAGSPAQPIAASDAGGPCAI